MKFILFVVIIQTTLDIASSYLTHDGMARGSRFSSSIFASSRGFGQSNTLNQKLNNKNKDSIKTLEETIKFHIDRTDGLREAMTLRNELREWEQSVESLSTARQSIPEHVVNVMNDKKNRLQQLRELGWTDEKVLNTLQEITWNNSAKDRDIRHQENSISYEMGEFLEKLFSYALFHDKSTTVRSILDVGTGTGSLLKYMKKYLKTTPDVKFDETLFHGVDISEEMITIAQKNHPKATFTTSRFQDFQSSRQYSSIIFNESLHYFMQPELMLLKAKNSLANEGRLVISHPKGYSNVSLQRLKNPTLVPSLLPVNDIFDTLAASIDMQVIVAPSVKSSHYLAVLEKK